MRFMNEWDIDQAEQLHAAHPILGPAVRTLRNLVDWTNSNSDGWAYWPKPCRAAEKLQELIEAHHPYRRNETDATEAEYKAALRPIKSFRTRHAATFDIVEV